MFLFCFQKQFIIIVAIIFYYWFLNIYTNLIKKIRRPEAVAHTCNSSSSGSWHVEIPWAQEVETSLGNMAKLSLQNIKKVCQGSRHCTHAWVTEWDPQSKIKQNKIKRYTYYCGNFLFLRTYWILKISFYWILVCFAYFNLKAFIFVLSILNDIFIQWVLLLW